MGWVQCKIHDACRFVPAQHPRLMHTPITAMDLECTTWHDGGRNQVNTVGSWRGVKGATKPSTCKKCNTLGNSNTLCGPLHAATKSLECWRNTPLTQTCSLLAALIYDTRATPQTWAPFMQVAALNHLPPTTSHDTRYSAACIQC